MLTQDRNGSVVEPAPLDPQELLSSLKPFGSSRMLPRAAYLDADVLGWERRHVFGGWVSLGRTDDLAPSPGVRAVSVGRSGVLLSRGVDGIVRAFENACRHRGHELLPCGEGAAPRAIVCPYHGWTYDYSGSLRGRPGFRSATDLDAAELGLVSLPLQDWHGWLFVDTSGSAGDFGPRIADLEPIVERYGAERLVTAASHVYDVAANWKVLVENYQECYHCSRIHPALCRVSPPDSGENLDPQGDWVGGRMSLRRGVETMALDGRIRGSVIARLDETERRSVLYVAVLPNLLVSLHPDYVMTHRLTPVEVNRTTVECSWAFPAGVVAADGFDASYAVDFWDLTNRQDWAACESVQRGMNTPHYTPGPLAAAEDGVYQFVTYLARAYLGRR